jgi:hypothetical protein
MAHPQDACSGVYAFSVKFQTLISRYCQDFTNEISKVFVSSVLMNRSIQVTGNGVAEESGY